jgi:hypothetical protein
VPKTTDVSCLLGLTLLLSSSAAHGQKPATVNGSELKTIVVAPRASQSVITVPPATSVRFSLSEPSTSGRGNVDLPNWLNEQTTLDGLQSGALGPWHIVVTYDQFDEDGDNVHSGTYEEYWAGPQKYKRVYETDDFHQTDYATDKGLFRSGDQHWPDRAQSYVRSEIVDPFSYATTFPDAHARKVERTFNRYKLDCLVIEDKVALSDPPQYCFEPNSSILRYSRGKGWNQTAYNQIVIFQGRDVAQDVNVTDGGKPYLKLRVETLELIPKLDDSAFQPPPGAVPIGDRVSGVIDDPISTRVANFPQLPASLRGQRVEVTVEIIIGKDGHVVSARGIAGPPEAYKACEDSVRQWVYRPFLVLNRPVEVVQRSGCTYN